MKDTDEKIEIINAFDLKDFDINVQSIERTFIDKVFAICEYYLKNKVTRYSRHIYDLYKLYPHVKFDENFLELIKETRSLRINSNVYTSLLGEQNVNVLLKEIINSEYYKSDFNNVTKILLYEKVKYEDAIEILDKIIKLNIF